jgi:hypothetical protein
MNRMNALNDFINSNEIRYDHAAIDDYIARAFAIFDDMRIDYDAIQFIIDDAHDDPQSYLMQSKSFIESNNECIDDINDFYASYNDDDIKFAITPRMIIEMIECEFINARNDAIRAIEMIANAS